MSMYINHFLTGIATPEPPTITTGTPPVVTTPPPSGPLEVHFANNTPHVVENTVTVQVHTNKPASATCRLGRVATMPCKQFIQCHKNTIFMPCTRMCITIHVSFHIIRYSILYQNGCMLIGVLPYHCMLWHVPSLELLIFIQKYIKYSYSYLCGVCS